MAALLPISRSGFFCFGDRPAGETAPVRFYLELLSCSNSICVFLSSTSSSLFLFENGIEPLLFLLHPCCDLFEGTNVAFCQSVNGKQIGRVASRLCDLAVVEKQCEGRGFFRRESAGVVAFDRLASDPDLSP